MPQMAPMYWLSLFLFFILTLFLFLTINHFLSSFKKIHVDSHKLSMHFKPWSL